MIEASKRFFFIFPLLVCIFCTIVISYRAGYFYYHESGKYIVNYIEHKPILAKLFDYRANDAQYYRPRELSNIFNMIDAHLVVLSFRLGVGHLLSPLHFLYMFLIAVSPLLYVFRQKLLRPVEGIIAMLLGLVFLTSAAPFFSTYYFRTSKSTVALLETILFWLIHRLHQTKTERINGVRFFGFVVLFLSLGITDETGILIALFFCAYLFLVMVIDRKNKLNRFMFFAALLGITGIGLYRVVLSPIITTSVIGMRPTAWGTISLAQNYGVIIINGINILKQYLSTLHGSIGQIIIYPLLLIVAYLLTAAGMERFVKNKSVVMTGFVAIGLLIVVWGGFSLSVGMMATVWPAVLTEKSTQLVYYPLPFVTLWFLLVCASIFYCIRRISGLKYIVVMAVCVSITINIFSLFSYQQGLKNDSSVGQYYGKAFSLINAIAGDAVWDHEVNPMPGQEIIYPMRGILGKK